MYIPKPFELSELTQLQCLIDERPLGMLLGTDSQGRSMASHVPMVWGQDEATGSWWLEGHMARANPQWQWLADQRDLLVVFSGPDAYVSPSLYDSPLAVPTWNYVAAHVYGELELVDDAAQIDALLKRMIARFEPGYAAQWRGLPEDFQHKLLGAIGGFRVHVRRWEGKAKLSQNRSPAERARLHQQQLSRGAAGAEMAGWMERLGLV